MMEGPPLVELSEVCADWMWMRRKTNANYLRRLTRPSN